MDFKRLNEDEQYKIAKKWLSENGTLTNSTYSRDGQSLIKVSFKDNNGNIIDQSGPDIIRLTIIIYNELNGDE